MRQLSVLTAAREWGLVESERRRPVASGTRRKILRLARRGKRHRILWQQLVEAVDRVIGDPLPAYSAAACAVLRVGL